MKTRPDMLPVLSFLKALKGNNNREWFQAHRAVFEAAQIQFEAYIGLLINELSPTESLEGLTPKDCIFRLSRDLRFTKDKTPYKPYMSAYIAPGGRKSRRLGYYVHIEPGDQSMVGGGLHQPEPQQLAAWRAAIDEAPEPFLEIVSSKSFLQHFGAVQGERLKTAPQGYPKDHPNLELLRLKSVTVSRSLSDAEVESPRLVEETLAILKAMRPFVRYLDSLSERDF